MNISRCLNVAVLTLLFGGPAAVFAQQPEERPQEPKQEEPKQEAPRPQEPKQEEPKPAEQPAHHPDVKPPRHEQQKSEEKVQQKEEKQQEKEEKDREKHEAKQNEQQQKAEHQQAEHQQMEERGHASRPAGKSARIPDDKFRQHFGRQHTFVVRQPVVVEGRPRIVYGGYTLVFVDPWPVEWAYTDDCYVDYIDGEYFLFDLLHPGVRIALFVSM